MISWSRKTLTAAILIAQTCMCVFGWNVVSGLHDSFGQVFFGFFLFAATCLQLVTLGLHLTVIGKKNVSKSRRTANLVTLVIDSLAVLPITIFLCGANLWEDSARMTMILGTPLIIALLVVVILNKKCRFEA